MFPLNPSPAIRILALVNFYTYSEKGRMGKKNSRPPPLLGRRLRLILTWHFLVNLFQTPKRTSLVSKILITYHPQKIFLIFNIFYLLIFVYKVVFDFG